MQMISCSRRNLRVTRQHLLPTGTRDSSAIYFYSSFLIDFIVIKTKQKHMLICPTPDKYFRIIHGMQQSEERSREE